MINSVSQTNAASNATVVKDSNDTKDVEKKPAPTEASIRAQTNQQILQASLQVSISSGDKPMQLLFRNAIDKINDALKPEFGDDAIKNAMSQDNSPKALQGELLRFPPGFMKHLPSKDLGKTPIK
nr:DUF5610 domain-containing protein [Iodobacter fluviatilis]